MPFTAGLDAERAEELLAALREVAVPPNHDVIRQGDVGDRDATIEQLRDELYATRRELAAEKNSVRAASPRVAGVRESDVARAKRGELLSWDEVSIAHRTEELVVFSTCTDTIPQEERPLMLSGSICGAADAQNVRTPRLQMAADAPQWACTA